MRRFAKLLCTPVLIIIREYITRSDSYRLRCAKRCRHRYRCTSPELTSRLRELVCRVRVGQLTGVACRVVDFIWVCGKRRRSAKRATCRVTERARTCRSATPPRAGWAAPGNDWRPVNGLCSRRGLAICRAGGSRDGSVGQCRTVRGTVR